MFLLSCFINFFFVFMYDFQLLLSRFKKLYATTMKIKICKFYVFLKKYSNLFLNDSYVIKINHYFSYLVHFSELKFMHKIIVQTFFFLLVSRSLSAIKNLIRITI